MDKKRITTPHEDEYSIDLEEYNAPDFFMGIILTIIFLICFLI